MRRHTVSDIYTTDHNRLPSVDCDAFGLTANVSGIKVWVIPLHCQPLWFTDPIMIVIKFCQGLNSMIQDRIAEFGIDRLSDIDFNS
jgi:hypothetical protein